MKTWQLQEAKARFSQLVKEAHKAPQSVTVHGKEEVVVLAKEEYERLSGSAASAWDLFKNAPKGDGDLQALIGPRRRDGGRAVDLGE
jgi:prevent-host-death family protein